MATVQATCVARLSSGMFAFGSRGGHGGKPRGVGPSDDPERAGWKKSKKRSFIILPADGGFSGTADGGGWTLWQESEAGSVLVGTRRARRRRQQMSDRWRKIMSLGGVEGAGPDDVSRRLESALENLERNREDISKVLHELERSNKGADVMAMEVKRLKVQKLRLKDDAARIRKAQRAAQNARELGEGSFGRVFLGRDVDSGEDFAVKVEDVLRADSAEGSMDDCQAEESLTVSKLNSKPPNEPSMDAFGEDDDGDDRVTPLRVEREMLTRVAERSGPSGFPRVHHFGRQDVFGRKSRVLVMDLLGPSLEDMSWAVSAGGPLSALTTLMIADQALARIAACHRAGVVHRDVKPDNLLLGHPKRGKGANRAVHLVDFGLAALGPAEGAALPDGVYGDDETDGRGVRRDVDGSCKKNASGTPAFSASAADLGRPPTYADDLEALVFTMSYLRAGTFPWCPGELRRDFASVQEYKAKAGPADLAEEACDQIWMGALLAHARAVDWGNQFDLSHCRGIVRQAFAEQSEGERMRDTLFDWEEAGVMAVPAEKGS